MKKPIKIEPKKVETDEFLNYLDDTIEILDDLRNAIISGELDGGTSILNLDLSMLLDFELGNIELVEDET